MKLLSYVSSISNFDVGLAFCALHKESKMIKTMFLVTFLLWCAVSILVTSISNIRGITAPTVFLVGSVIGDAIGLFWLIRYLYLEILGRG